MSRNTNILLFLGLAACGRYETGIDRTLITGTLKLVPAEQTEAETTMGANDELALAEDMGFVGYRVARVSGTGLDFATNLNTDAVEGDWDWYTFSPLLEGALTLSLSYAGPEEVDTAAPPRDDTVFAVRVLDLDTLDENGDPTPIYDGDTTGWYGAFATELTVSAKGHYAIGLGGARNKSDDNSYELRLSGFDPNGVSFLVGAYQEADFGSHGNPVGGTSVEEFSFDESTLTWSGSYELHYVREVITCTEDDADCLATQTARQIVATLDTGSSDGDDTADTADTGGPDDTLDTSATIDTSDTDPGGDDTGDTSDTSDTGGGDTGSGSGGDTGDSDTGGVDTGSADDTGSGSSGGSSGGGSSGGGDDSSAEDSAPEPGLVTDVNEDLPVVYLFAGTFASLNAGILAGTHFSSEGVMVELSTDDAETDLHEGVDLSVDAIQPLLVGWEYAEVEPNDVAIDDSGATYDLVGDLSAANPLPLGTGLGYVDFISGSLVYTTADPQWGDDADVFALEVAEPAGATISLEWADAADDIDLHMYDSQGALIAAGWYINNSNPESFSTADFGFTLEPGETYYIAVLGYYGAAGDHPWSLSIEYASP